MPKLNKTENQLLQVLIFIQKVSLGKLDLKNGGGPLFHCTMTGCFNFEGILAYTQTFKEIDIIFDLMGGREAGIIYCVLEMS